MSFVLIFFSTRHLGPRIMRLRARAPGVGGWGGGVPPVLPESFRRLHYLGSCPIRANEVVRKLEERRCCKDKLRCDSKYGFGS